MSTETPVPSRYNPHVPGGRVLLLLAGLVSGLALTPPHQAAAQADSNGDKPSSEAPEAFPGETSRVPPGSTPSWERRLEQLEQQMGSDGLLNLAQELASLREIMHNLYDQVEKSNHELERLQNQLRQVYKALDERLRRVEVARRNTFQNEELSTSWEETPADLLGLNHAGEAPSRNPSENILFPELPRGPANEPGGRQLLPSTGGNVPTRPPPEQPGENLRPLPPLNATAAPENSTPDTPASPEAETSQPDSPARQRAAAPKSSTPDTPASPEAETPQPDSPARQRAAAQENSTPDTPAPPEAETPQFDQLARLEAQPSTPGLVSPVNRQQPERPEGQSAGPSEPEAEPDPIMAKADYDKAFNLLRLGHYQQAVGSFQEYLRRHPRDPQRANAEYWVAEAYYVTQDYRQAIRHIGAFLDRYPKNKKYPQALYKLARSHLLLGDRQSAQRMFRDVQRRFPDSSAARLARREMEQIANSNSESSRSDASPP